MAHVGWAQGRDTAFAVHKLFVHHRGGGEALAASGASMVAGSTTAAGAAAGVLVGAAPVALGLTRAARYSAQREAEILQLYANGWPIPADVWRRLRPKCFHRTVRDLKP